MTVSELIDELKKHPSHCTMMMVVPSAEPLPGAHSDYYFIDDVQFQTNAGDIGIIVKLLSKGAE